MSKQRGEKYMKGEINYVSGNPKSHVERLQAELEAGELICPKCGGEPVGLFGIYPNDQFAAGAPYGKKRVLFFSFCGECIVSNDLVDFIKKSIVTASQNGNTGECVQGRSLSIAANRQNMTSINILAMLWRVHCKQATILL